MPPTTSDAGDATRAPDPTDAGAASDAEAADGGGDAPEDSGSRDGGGAGKAPPCAASAGYGDKVFADEFTSLDTVDVENTQAAGFNWYVTGDFFRTTVPASALSIVKTGGVSALSLSGAGNYSLLGAIAKNDKVLGHSFSNGAYFEARIAMSVPENGAKSWPSFWGLPNLGGNSEHWAGNPNSAYVDSVEMDIMEFMPHSETGTQTIETGSTLHDWYATNHSQVASSYKFADSATVKLESTTAAPVFNTIGALWVPSVKGSQGYVQFCMNDEPFGNKITWVGQPGSTAATTNDWTPTSSAASTPWTFGAMDLFPQSLILSNGGNAFYYVQFVRVWQKT